MLRPENSYFDISLNIWMLNWRRIHSDAIFKMTKKKLYSDTLLNSLKVYYSRLKRVINIDIEIYRYRIRMEKSKHNYRTTRPKTPISIHRWIFECRIAVGSNLLRYSKWQKSFFDKLLYFSIPVNFLTLLEKNVENLVQMGAKSSILWYSISATRKQKTISVLVQLVMSKQERGTEVQCILKEICGHKVSFLPFPPHTR